MVAFAASDRWLVLLAIGPRDHKFIRFDARFQLSPYDPLREILAQEITVDGSSTVSNFVAVAVNGPDLWTVGTYSVAVGSGSP